MTPTSPTLTARECKPAGVDNEAQHPSANGLRLGLVAGERSDGAEDRRGEHAHAKGDEVEDEEPVCGGREWGGPGKR